MKRLLFFVVAMLAALPCFEAARAQHRTQYEKLVATHAKANLVPEALVHRVIVRESKYRPDLVGRGGTIGLMQIKLPTARGLGYTGDAEGLRDPDTNLAYGVKYLAGAYRAANGDHDRAVHYYASGYYGAAKLQRLEALKRAGPVLASAPLKEIAKPQQVVKPEQAAKPVEAAKLAEVAPAPPGHVVPKVTVAKPRAAARPKHPQKKLMVAGEPVPRPPASIPTGAKPAKPR